MFLFGALMDEGELLVPVGRDAAIERVRAAINQPAKRMFGFKVADQFVGVVQGDRFEVWERRRHAVHLVGEVSARPGGSAIALRSGLSGRVRALVGVFALLYVVLAVGLVGASGERAVPAPIAAAVGAVAAAAVFYASVRTQRAALRKFVRSLFEDAPPD